MAKVKVNDRAYAVVVWLGEGDATDECSVADFGLADRPACERWIRDNGKADCRYHVVVFVGQVLRVAVEKVEKRSLLPATKDTEAPEKA